MPFDGIVTANVVYDINNKLVGGKIEKVYQPEKDEIVLSVHAGKTSYKLLLSCSSSHARAHFISQAPPNPVSPPTFCMLLRKHIQGGRISGILQKDTERIIEISIDSFNELGVSVSKKLVIEIMGKHSNIILLEEETDKIIDSIKRISFDVNRYRQLLPGKTYIYPPTQDKIPFSKISSHEFSNIIEETEGFVSNGIMSKIQGISPFCGEHLCICADINEKSLGKNLSTLEKEKLASCFIKLTTDIANGNFTPMVYLDEHQTPVDFYAFAVPQLSLMYEEKAFDDIGQAAEFYYNKKNSSNRVSQKSTDLMKLIHTALDKLYLKKQRLCEEIVKAEASDIYRLKGEVLLANLYQITQGQKKITLENYYDHTPLTIDLDELLSPSGNAQRYYKKYTKAKTALKEKNVQLTETNKELEYLESVLTTLENATDFNDVDAIRSELVLGGYAKKRKTDGKAKLTQLAPHTYYSSEGFKIQAGRNNKQNDVLTLKTAMSKDLWFHTKDIPGTHVILSTQGEVPGEASILEAASIAAFHSKGKQSQNVPVDYTYVKFVKKPSGAKPGMVIFTNNKTLYVNPSLPISPTPAT